MVEGERIVGIGEIVGMFGMGERTNGDPNPPPRTHSSHPNMQI